MILSAILMLGALRPSIGSQRMALPVPATAEDARHIRRSSSPLVRFLESAGWTVTYDRRSGEPMLLEGPPIAWNLDADEPMVPAAARGNVEATLRKLQRAETHARTLMNDDSIELDETWSRAADDEATLLYITFRPKQPSDSRLTFVVNHGNLVQVHAERWRTLRHLTASIGAEEAWTRVAMPGEVVEFSQLLTMISLGTTDEPSGVYTGPYGKGYDDRLVWSFRFRIRDDQRTFVANVDATDGSLVELFDDNDYATVTGSIYPRTVGPSEVRVPFPTTAVLSGTTVTTDLGGNYVFGGGTASTSLDGTFFLIADTCGAPNALSTSDGDIDLGSSSTTNCSFSDPGHSTRAARNAHYHLNLVRRLAMKWLTGVNAKAENWLNTNVTVNVNINQTCNAFWNGTTVNGFRSGSGCANTAEIGDVMQHEWGHGLDQNTKTGSVGDTAKGNAIGDAVTLLVTHDQCIAPGFLLSGTGGETVACPDAISDLAREVTVANIASQCPTSSSCAGALGYECHCEAHILSGAYLKLQQAYRSEYGDSEGWNLFEKTFLRSLPNVTSYPSGTAGNAYDAWMAADDDNGNLVDGTPNADIVYQAFNSQGIGGTQRAKHAVQCINPPGAIAPTLTVENHAIGVSWPAVTGATSYSIFRRLAISGGSPAFLPLAANVTGTSYLDSEVAIGFQYDYQVVGVLSNGCVTPYGAGSSATAETVPENVVATAISKEEVEVTWDAVTKDSAYTISRSIDGTNFTVVGTQMETTLRDSGLDPDTTYIYRVALEGSIHGGKDLATTIVFSDDPLQSGAPILSLHATELRTAIAAVLAVSGEKRTYSNSAAAGTVISATDVTEMRSYLEFARSQIPGIHPMAPYGDASIAGGTTPIRAAQMTELRDGVK